MPVHKVINPITGGSVSLRWSKKLEGKYPEIPIWMKLAANMSKEHANKNAAFIVAPDRKTGILTLYDATLRYFKGKFREALPLHPHMGVYIGGRLQMQMIRPPSLRQMRARIANSKA